MLLHHSPLLKKVCVLDKWFPLIDSNFQGSFPMDKIPLGSDLKIHQRGVQWKQGVVICMMLYTSLLYSTTPIHYTPLRIYVNGLFDTYDRVYYVGREAITATAPPCNEYPDPPKPGVRDNVYICV